MAGRASGPGAVAYLWRTPLAEWPGVLHNNLDAVCAIWRARRHSNESFRQWMGPGETTAAIRAEYPTFSWVVLMGK